MNNVIIVIKNERKMFSFKGDFLQRRRIHI